jgi:hypothetical protein
MGCPSVRLSPPSPVAKTPPWRRPAFSVSSRRNRAVMDGPLVTMWCSTPVVGVGRDFCRFTTSGNWATMRRNLGRPAIAAARRDCPASGVVGGRPPVAACGTVAGDSRGDGGHSRKLLRKLLVYQPTSCRIYHQVDMSEKINANNGEFHIC